MSGEFKAQASKKAKVSKEKTLDEKLVIKSEEDMLPIVSERCLSRMNQVTGIQCVDIVQAGASRISADVMLSDLQTHLKLESDDAGSKIKQFSFESESDVREIRSVLNELYREGLHQSLLCGIAAYRELSNSRQVVTDRLVAKYRPFFDANLNDEGFCEIRVVGHRIKYFDATWKIVYKREIDSFDNLFQFNVVTKVLPKICQEAADHLTKEEEMSPKTILHYWHQIMTAVGNT